MNCHEARETRVNTSEAWQSDNGVALPFWGNVQSGYSPLKLSELANHQHEGP